MNDIKQITVFGGSGFIGRHVIRRLAKRGATLRVPSRDPEKALLLRPMGLVGQVVPLPCQVRDEGSVARAIGTSDAVINLLGILAPVGRDTFQTVHVETTARIARIAHELGVKHMVQMSALGASDHSRSAYARSKAAAERAALTFFPDAVLLRPSLVFGPEDKFFNRFAAMAHYMPALPLIGGGRSRFQPVYVGDVAEAVVRSLMQASARGQVFELGGPQTYSFHELLTLILKVTDKKRILFDMPFGMASLQGAILERLPGQLLTRDQVELLKTDNILDGGARSLRDLGIDATALELILPTYLSRFRKEQVRLRAAP